MVRAPSEFDSLLQETRPLALRFAARRRSLYLVGGVVRDTLVTGRAPVDRNVDIDLTTDAQPDEIEAILRSARPTAVWTQGKRFGTVGARLVGPDGPRAYEVTTHRADAYSSDSRKPAVAFSSDIGADLSRRDFTVNAMAVSVLDGTFVDPFDGAADLRDRALRTPIAAAESFTDDPLRMLRAARFIARFGLTPSDDVVEAIAEVRPRLAIVSRERVRDELTKLLELAAPGRGLVFLSAAGLLADTLPALGPPPPAADRAEPSELFGRSDAEHRWLEAVDLLGGVIDRVVAILLRGGPDAHGGGARDAMEARVAAVLRGLRASTAERDDADGVLRARVAILEAAAGPVLTSASLRRVAWRSGPHLDRGLALVSWEAARRSGDGGWPTSDALHQLVGDLARLASTEDITAMASPLDGAAVMDHLGIAPGRVVGEALAMLTTARVEHGPMDRRAAQALLDDWWRSRRENGATA